MDICWLQVGNKLIDLDEIWALLYDTAKEMQEEIEKEKRQ